MNIGYCLLAAGISVLVLALWRWYDRLEDRARENRFVERLLKKSRERR